MLIKFVRMGVRGNRGQFSMWSMCASVSANGLQRGKGDGGGDLSWTTATSAPGRSASAAWWTPRSEGGSSAFGAMVTFFF